ncbi:MAG: flagellar motor switch protein FliN, partial [Deltaproteobacteria bacterium]
GQASLKPGDMDINFLLDVNLSIMVEVGRTHMLIEDLLRLEENSIVELDSMVGQPLNIRANEKLVARGEIVVINEKFAVRITDIISPDDRFAAL